MSRFLRAAALVALLGACATPTPPTAGAGLIIPPDEGTPVRGATTGRECSNAGLDQFRGRQATSETGAEMLRVSGARILRWAPPGMIMTMEFSSERLTVHLDSANRIERPICG